MQPPAWVLEPDGWIQAKYDVPPDAWYFKADRTPAVPISIILEIALQPCGWLAAYMGSALKSDQDLRFRNLGGTAELSGELLPDCGTLTTRTRLTRASEAGDMIIEHFDFEVWQQNEKRYAGNTYFGFFTSASLARQQGLSDADKQVYIPHADELKKSRSCELADDPPLFPQDTASHAGPGMAMPARAIRMIDRIETWIPDGGPKGLGFIRGTKIVNPQEWFFKAHFYQDPVCPGSLGIESFIQLLKFMAIQRWPELADSHRFGLATPSSHSWIYRGQIIPTNQLVTVEAVVTRLVEHPLPTVMADGFLMVDGLVIYKMKNFGLQLVPLK
jgi:3-hydroxymyristoyl/3-hydroxydecanoyl-(acyl carrier protein) dehydratase